MCVRSDTKTARREAVVAEDRRDAAERLERRPALVLDEDRRRRHAARDGVRPGRCGLGRPVALGLAAGHDEVRREPGLVQVDRVVEAGLEDRRRPAVVLGGAEDDDRVGRPRVVAVADVPDPERRPADDDDRGRRSPRATSRTSARGSSPWPGRADRRAGRPPASAAVALLVLQARAAPARIVAADPGAGRGEAGLAPAPAGTRPPVAAGSSRARGHRVGGEAAGDDRPDRPRAGRPAAAGGRGRRAAAAAAAPATPPPPAAVSAARRPAARLCVEVRRRRAAAGA